MRALTSGRRDQEIVAPKVAVVVTAVHAMDAAPKDLDRKAAVDVGRTMALAIAARKVVVAVRTVAVPKVADRVAPMAHRDRRIRSGSSIASMKTKMVR